MTEKENALIALKGGKPEWTPCYFKAVQSFSSGVHGEGIAPGIREGLDGYGVSLTATESANGALTPTPGVDPVIPDIDCWRENLSLPDPDAIDWEQASKRDLERFQLDRENRVTDFIYPKGLFERMHFLMGVENTLCALLTDPEEIYEFAGVLADNKIRFIKKIGQYYKPDILTSMDDFAHQKGNFMSLETFRELFKPHLKRMVDATHEAGMMFKLHCCGKMEDFAQDFLELGIDAIDPVQPMNDYDKVFAVFGGKVGVCGGLDVQNVVDRSGVTEEEIRQEVRRCIDSYKKYGNYMIYGASIDLHNPIAYTPGHSLYTVIDECEKYQR